MPRQPSSTAERSAAGPFVPPAERERRAAWTRRAMLLLVLALAAVFAWREETSLDLGFHLATGRWILEHHAWPRTDPFTYTVADHAYIDMHGLFQVLLALAHRALGIPGLALLRLAFLLGTTAMLWSAARRRGVLSPVLLGLGFGLGIAAWELRFLTRPELATFLLLAAELALLRRHAESGRARWLWCVVPLQWVWVLSHALSSFGVFVLGLYALSRTVDDLRRRAFSPLPWIVLAAATATLALNPYGLTGVAFLWSLHTRVQQGNVFGETIGELDSPFSPGLAGLWPIVAFQVLLVTTAVIAVARFRRAAPFDTALTLVFGVLAALRMRAIGMFVVATLPITLEGAAALGRSLPPSWARVTLRFRPAAAAVTAAALVLVGVLVATGRYDPANPRPARFGCGESPASYPIATTARLEAGELHGPLFNTMDLGGYLIGALWPREKVFADGRLEVMGDAFFKECIRIDSGEGWADMVRRYAPNVALVNQAAEGLLHRIQSDPDWSLVEVDGVAVLFARALPEHRAAIAAAQTRLRSLNTPAPAGAEALWPDELPGGARGALGLRRFPFEAWGRGNGFVALGMLDAARREYRRGLLEGGGEEPSLVANYVSVIYRLGRVTEATAWCRRLVRIAPWNADARRLLAQLEAMS